MLGKSLIRTKPEENLPWIYLLYILPWTSDPFHAFFGPFAPTFRRRQLEVVDRSAAGRMLNNVIDPIEHLIPVRARRFVMGTGQLLIAHPDPSLSSLHDLPGL